MAALALGVLLTAVTTAAPDAAGCREREPPGALGQARPAGVVGRPAELRVTAMAGTAPVSGVVVRFGREDSFGLSACLADSSGHSSAPDPFAPGSKVRFAVPHTFRRAGPRGVLVRLDAGGCAMPGPSAFQPLIVTADPPRRAGRAPHPAARAASGSRRAAGPGSR